MYDLEYYRELYKTSVQGEQEWLNKAQKYYRIYNGQENDVAYNIFHSNVNILLSALYSDKLIVKVTGNILAPDSEIQVCAEALTNYSTYILDNSNFDREVTKVIQDYLITGRGVMRIKYNPLLSEDKKNLLEEELKFDHIAFDRFVLPAANSWQSLKCIFIKHYLTRDEFIDFFDKSNLSQVEFKDQDDQIMIIECWDKRTKKVLFFDLYSGNNFFKIVDDPLKLKDFFPVIEPLQSMYLDGGMTPVAEFDIIAKRMGELNVLTNRKNSLLKQLKYIGYYLSNSKDIVKHIATASDGDMIPIPLSSKTDTLSSKDFIKFLPVDKVSDVIAKLEKERQEIINSIYEITGISDILRGVSDARESATAQNIKMHYGNLRIAHKRSAVDNLLCSSVSMLSQIILNVINPKQIYEVTGFDIETSFREKATLNFDHWFKFTVNTGNNLQYEKQQKKEKNYRLIQSIIQIVKEVSPLISAGQLPNNSLVEFINYLLSPYEDKEKLIGVLRK